MPAPLLQIETFPGAGAPLNNYIAAPWEYDAQGWVEMNLQENSYNPFAIREEYKSVQSGIMKMGLMMYYNNDLKEENSTLCFPSLENSDGVQKLVAT